MRQSDEGLSPVIAIVMLIGMVAVAGAVIGLSMFATLDDMSGAVPDVRFQISADGQLLYHAGGDVLYKRDLIFYDTVERIDVTDSVALKKSGKDTFNSDWDTWETGDVVRVTGGISIANLSVVGQDSKGRAALLYLGAGAILMPVGDMVPDEWTEGGEVGGDEPDWPPYKIGPTISWGTIRNTALNNYGATLGHNVIYQDDNSIFYHIAIDSQYLSVDDAEKFVKLDDYASQHQNTMIKIDLSSKILTYDNDTYVDPSSNNRKWNTGTDGKRVAQIGSLYEYEKNLYIAIRDLWDEAVIPTENPGHWSTIGSVTSP